VRREAGREATRRIRGAGTVFGVVTLAGMLLVACGGSDGGSDGAFVPPKTGPAIYKTYCATCHGKQGEGFVGPSLVDIADKYPDIADEISVVANGKNQMPAWSGRLTPKQIETVVDYTRTEFATSSVGPSAP
jgi:mono/diheme cytochrome c family protein